MPLTPAQTRQLKSLAHHLKPVVIVGSDGLKSTIIAALNEALEHHELIKVRVNAKDREQRQAWITQMCDTTHSEMVTSIGHTACLFRRNRYKPRITLV